MDILNKERNYPKQLTPDPSWEVFDSTKLNEYQTCPRKFFFRFIAGLGPEYESHHLIFGRAIHVGLEVLIKNLHKTNRDVAIAEAYNAFLQDFNSTPLDPFVNLKLKTPESALRIFMEYDKLYYLEDREMEVLFTEVAGTIPVDEDYEVTFKVDAIVRKDGQLFVLEHKTTSADSAPWRAQWLMSLQVGTYMHVLYTLGYDETVGGVIINGIVPRTKDIGLIRVPIYRDEGQMETWQYQVRQIITEIEFNYRLLSQASDEDNLLKAFPMRTTSCVSYGATCPYMQFCQNQKNPLRVLDPTPLGFAKRFWNPLLENTASANYVLTDGVLKEIEHAGASEEQRIGL